VVYIYEVGSNLHLFQDFSESDRIFQEPRRSGGSAKPPRFEEAVVHRLQKSRNEGLAGIDWSFLQVRPPGTVGRPRDCWLMLVGW